MRANGTATIKAIALAISLGLGVSGSAAFATKLVAPPLPREREVKDFGQGQSIIVPPSRFERRPDYRELEAEKKRAAEEAAKKAQEDKLKAAEEARKAQAEKIENVKKRQQLAVEANNKAVASGKQGNWTEAIAAHEEAVKLDPQNKQFRINLSAARTAFGQARMSAGDFNGAASLFRKALAAAPDNGLAGRLLVEAMKRMGRNPESADVRIATGDQLAAINDFEGASVEYQAALQLENSARAHVKMGDVALRFGQVSTATNWYRQAIVKDPEYGPAHRQLGMMALMQKDYTGAAAALRKAVIMDPKDVAAGQALVEIWRRQVATNPLLAENHLGLAGALQLTGDFVGAESEYRKLEALDPKNPGLESGRNSLARAIQHAKAEKHKMAAETLFGQGLRREALAEISQAVMLEPRNARFQFLLGECLESVGDYQGAHRAYLTCVLIDPENNKEAAARMKEMQSGHKSAAHLGSQVVNQVASQITGQHPAPVQQAMVPQAPPQSVVAQEHTFPRKDMYEGGPGAPAHFAGADGFRGHDEREPAVASVPASPAALGHAAALPAAAPEATDAQPVSHDAFSQVTDLESQKNYSGAISLLRQMLTTNLQNSEVHHRLAVNLLASGQITEAVSEFRIASALNPGKRAYADDLARALAIHKRSMASSAGTQASSENHGVNAGEIQ